MKISTAHKIEVQKKPMKNQIKKATVTHIKMMQGKQCMKS